jgi:hypothetical protein
MADLTAEAISRIVDLAGAVRQEIINGRVHTVIPAGWSVVEDYKAIRPLETLTLQSIVDYFRSAAKLDTTDRDLLIHVEHHAKVSVLAVLDDAQRRECILTATVPGHTNEALPMKTWLAPDKMIQGLLVAMVPTPERDATVAMLSNLRDGRVIEAVDDGIGQAITVKTGVTLVGATPLRSSIVLRPRWTFGEVEQPEVGFVIRAKSGEGESLPSFSLSVADVEWQADTIIDIRDWLRQGLPEAIILA